jgi:hypothetical protein
VVARRRTSGRERPNRDDATRGAGTTWASAASQTHLYASAAATTEVATAVEAAAHLRAHEGTRRSPPLLASPPPESAVATESPSAASDLPSAPQSKAPRAGRRRGAGSGASSAIDHRNRRGRTPACIHCRERETGALVGGGPPGPMRTVAASVPGASRINQVGDAAALTSRPHRPPVDVLAPATGRPLLTRSLRELLLRLVREDSHWGYRRIVGELEGVRIRRREASCGASGEMVACEFLTLGTAVPAGGSMSSSSSDSRRGRWSTSAVLTGTDGRRPADLVMRFATSTLADQRS